MAPLRGGPLSKRTSSSSKQVHHLADVWQIGHYLCSANLHPAASSCASVDGRLIRAKDVIELETGRCSRAAPVPTRIDEMWQLAVQVLSPNYPIRVETLLRQLQQGLRGKYWGFGRILCRNDANAGFLHAQAALGLRRTTRTRRRRQSSGRWGRAVGSRTCGGSTPARALLSASASATDLVNSSSMLLAGRVQQFNNCDVLELEG